MFFGPFSEESEVRTFDAPYRGFQEIDLRFLAEVLLYMGIIIIIYIYVHIIIIIIVTIITIITIIIIAIIIIIYMYISSSSSLYIYVHMNKMMKDLIISVVPGPFCSVKKPAW